MPSDRAAFESKLSDARQCFHDALVSSFEELRGLLRANKRDLDPKVDGEFTSEYLDTGRFNALTPQARTDACDWGRLEQAKDVLGELVAKGDELYHVQVAPGESARCGVMRAMADIGRAFAAARTASLAQAGLPGTEDEAENLQAWPFARWSRTERALAPTLLIETSGEDLGAECLIEFLDGGCKLAFLVSGPASPAPLAGLIRPGIHVAQYGELPGDLDLPEGRPAAVGVFPDAGDATARFVHAPAADGETGEGIWGRLELEALPAEAPTGSLGRRSAKQQTEELRLLASLAIRPSGEPSADTAAHEAPEGDATRSAREGAAASTDPVDRLAAWLLGKRRV